MSRKKLPPHFSRAKGMLVFTPTSDHVKEAFERSEKLGVLPNSFTRGAGRMTGFLGEVAFECLYPQAVYKGDTELTYDYLLGKKTIDIKSKSCAGIPQPHYTASVNCPEGKKLLAKAYFFVRVRKDFQKAWLLGWATATKIQKHGDYKLRGEPDDYGFTYKVDGYHIPIAALRRASSLK
jgi:hypothetical protein|tara:strand:+ start:162 stop:698 length:537 start_codon:yes stop_codon:yes gene_type:complete